MLMLDAASLSYPELIRQSKQCDYSACRSSLRLAILSDAAVPQLVPLIKVLCARHGVRADVYLGEFDAIEIDVFDQESGLYAFRPQAVVILNSINSLRLKYYRWRGSRGEFSEGVVARMEALWDALGRYATTTIIQSNYVLPYERLFGNFEHKVPDALCPSVLAINEQMVARARSRSAVLINDLEALASYVGRKNWFDERMWTLCKAFCAFEYLPLVARNIVDIVLSNAGRVVKCVVVDLDNTLWGGVIGDDGMEGIVVSPSGEGEPFQHLQHYLLELKRRGIVLAACSKNNHATAIEPFRRHPEMILREDDFAIFMANWDPKPDNIRTIQATLAIGFDSMVFLDDNPFERQLVRETLPEVIVPELPEDPSEYVRAISELNLFEATSVSEENRRRTHLYQARAQRERLRQQVSDIREYLRSLDMKICMKRFDAFHLPRIAQLIQRSNQFNLATRRYSLAECEALMRDPAYLPVYVKLSDKFGDNGLISVIILKRDAPELVVDEWLMSCRVLGRGVEQHAMNRIVAFARSAGYPTLVGSYLPTAKNGMVKEFYAQFGFDKVAEERSGETRWRLRVTEYKDKEVCLDDLEEDTDAQWTTLSCGSA